MAGAGVRGARRPRAGRAARRTRRGCWRAAEEALAARGRGLGGGRPARGRRRAGELHGAADRDRDGARAGAGARAAAGRRELAGGAGARGAGDAGRSCSPSSTRAAARRSPPPGRDGRRCCAPAALAPEALAERVRALPAAPLAVGDGAVRFRDSLEAAGALVPPDEDGAPSPPRRARVPAGCGGEPNRPRRTPTRLPARARRRTPHDDRPARRSRDPPPDLRRPPAGRRDRAPRVPDAVVAGDVRARALQARRACAWRRSRARRWSAT